MTFLLRHFSKSYIHTSTAAEIVSRCSLNSISTHVNRGPPTFQVLRSFVTVKESVSGFDEMVCGSQRKYYMVGGKGGVGKTSCAASLAVKFASQGQHTIVVSTDPAHSLSDAFDQNLSGGMLVPVRGVDSTLYALEINTEKAREDYRTEVTQHGDAIAKSYLDMMGLGKLADQFGDIKVDELMDSQPPGLSYHYWKEFMQILELQELSKFKRIVFDSPPTGYALRLLAFPDIWDAYIGKMIELKKEIQSPASELESALEKGAELDDDLKKEISSLVSELKSALGEEVAQPADARLSKEITSLFGEEAAQQHSGPDTLEQFREKMAKVRDLFHDPKSMEFVIVTIPTVMAVNESSRLCASLREDQIPVKRLIVNQVMMPPSSASDCKFCAMRRKDQMRALALIEKDPELAKLRLIQSPLMDVEIRGVPALKYMADMLWR